MPELQNQLEMAMKFRYKEGIIMRTNKDFVKRNGGRI